MGDVLIIVLAALLFGALVFALSCGRAAALADEEEDRRIAAELQSRRRRSRSRLTKEIR